MKFYLIMAIVLMISSCGDEIPEKPNESVIKNKARIDFEYDNNEIVKASVYADEGYVGELDPKWFDLRSMELNGIKFMLPKWQITERADLDSAYLVLSPESEISELAIIVTAIDDTSKKFNDTKSILEEEIREFKSGGADILRSGQTNLDSVRRFRYLVYEIYGDTSAFFKISKYINETYTELGIICNYSSKEEVFKMNMYAQELSKYVE